MTSPVVAAQREDQLGPADDRSSGWPKRRWLVVGVLAALSVFAGACTWIAMSRGPGLTPDAINYLRNAESVLDGTGIQFLPASYGPGFPYLIAAGEFVGLTADSAVRVINSVATGAAVFLAFVLLARHVRTRWLVAAGTIIVALSPALLGVSRMAWSEPVFSVLILLLVLALEEVARRPRSLVWLAIAVVLIWLIFLVRFAGLCFVVAGPLTVLFVTWRLGRRRAILRAAAVGAVAWIVPAAWMIRNFALTGMPLGPRPPAATTPGEVLRLQLVTIGDWVVVAAPYRASIIAGITVWLVVVACAVALLRQSKPSSAPSPVDVARDGGRAHYVGGSWPSSAIPIVVLSATYVAYVSLSELSTGLDPISDRLMTPVYVPLIVILAGGLDLFLRWLPRGNKAAAVIAAAVLVAIAVGSAQRVLAVVRTSANDGVGYASQQWQQSPLLNAMKYLPAGATVYVNQNQAAVIAVSRHNNTIGIGSHTLYRSSALGVSVSAVAASIACHRGSYLAWFNQKQRATYLTPAELAAKVQLTVVTTFSDGTLYRVSATPQAGASCPPG